ncbi:S9 family peptidase [Rhodospirillum centenum]|uniref:Protease II, ptrB, putative n=1 Tax=Rhodospirillum centenum (strain ATCC 51521 / SW) TaxID=414684 RepID=B6IUE9_RHOCS|nr:S9 family peptidase [Rhodospirillum centenum]ACJ00129.1 protease II, ptrB, putative [Rhodospirillum centenum SW]
MTARSRSGQTPSGRPAGNRPTGGVPAPGAASRALIGAALGLALLALPATGASAASAATTKDAKTVAFKQSSFGPPPVAKVAPTTLEKHGDVRVDDYFWMRDPDYPTVDDEAILAQLKAENAYIDQVLGGEETGLRKSLFDEMLARIKQDDTGVPYREGDWEYQSRFETGKQYPIFVRRPWGKTDAPFATILDVNELAGRTGYTRVGAFAPSPDGRYLAFAEDDDGSIRFTVRIKDLQTGKFLPDLTETSSASLAWSADGKYLFYNLQDENIRPKKILRHTLGEAPGNDVVVHEEPDGPWTVGIGRTLSGELLVIYSDNNATNEVRLLPADRPEAKPTLFVERKPFVETYVTNQGDTLWIRTNDTHRNFRLVKAPAADPRKENWVEVLPGDDHVYLTDVIAFKDWLVIFDKLDGQDRVRVRDAQGNEHTVAFPDAAFTVGAGANEHYETGTLRLSYQSLVTPPTTYDYDMKARTLTVRKVQEIPSGYDASLYTSERLMAPARDGRTMIPVSIVYRKDRPTDGSAPLHVYGYGSYGYGTDPTFSPSRLSLLDRGFAFAILHVRGGDDLGRGWYEDGKLEHKVNTFTDFIDATQFLVKKGYARAGNVSLSGGSAGGLLVGAVMNMAPEGLYGAAVAHVPFVDVVTTMLDDSLPLTAGEYDEWGNPNEKDAYFRMKSYSPYDNVTARAYPHTLITAGIADSQVTYWEPAKWAALLRARKTDDNVLLSYTNLGAGHGGASGRFDKLKEVALSTAFLLRAHGVQ